jgi:U3 small nucleolar RNA-associated protein 15
MLAELYRREGHIIALSGRDEESLSPLLEFFSRYVTDPKYSLTLIPMFDSLLGKKKKFYWIFVEFFILSLELYSSIIGESSQVDSLFSKVRRNIQHELNFQRKVLGVIGSLDLLLATGSLRTVAAAMENSKDISQTKME